MGLCKDIQHFEQTSREFINTTATVIATAATIMEHNNVSGIDRNHFGTDDAPLKNSRVHRLEQRNSCSELPTSNKKENVFFKFLKAVFSGMSQQNNDIVAEHSAAVDEKETDCIQPISQISNHRQPSSGYGSMEASTELDGTYIKVSKIAESDEENEMGVFGSFKEFQEQQQQQALGINIKKVIESYTDRCIQVTDHLTLRMAGDVVNLSKNEPYGLKGCKLIVVFQEGYEEVKLGSIYPEKGLICTFEITLVIHLKRHPCRRFLIGCSQKKMDVLNQYELRIEKMYTQNKSRRSSPTYCR